MIVLNVLTPMPALLSHRLSGLPSNKGPPSVHHSKAHPPIVESGIRMRVLLCVPPPPLTCVVVGVLTDSADVANVEFECLVVQKLRTDLLRGESVLRLAATRTSAVLHPVSVAGQGQQSKGLITYLLLPVVNKVCTTSPTSITSTLLSRYMLYISFYIVNVTIRVSGNLESTG